jgi:hypothetical protein
LINNRQNGRRRGRGGGPRTPNSAPQVNRQDNRSRGNASQLHEKYKALARDAQLAGDRVQAEYYLQFADHYFRVLNESRARFEEQRRQRGDYQSDEDEEQEEAVSAARDRDDEEQDEEERQERQERRERQASRNEGVDREPRARRPRRRDDREEEESDSERISLDSLPPPIAVVDTEEVRPVRRRATRRPRGETGETEIAPAA